VDALAGVAQNSDPNIKDIAAKNLGVLILILLVSGVWLTV
jgi:hypothetical protein